MNAKLAVLKTQFNNQSLREKIFTCLIVLVSIYFIFDYAVLAGLERENRQLRNKIDKVKYELRQLKAEQDEIAKQATNKKKGELLKQAMGLQGKLIKLDETLHGFAKDVFSPASVTRDIRQLLSQFQDLNLQKIETLKPEVIKEIGGEKVDTHLYKHVIVVEFTGNYVQTKAFLQKLERQELGLVWEAISYRVMKYPIARIALKVHLLSISKN